MQIGHVSVQVDTRRDHPKAKQTALRLIEERVNARRLGQGQQPVRAPEAGGAFGILSQDVEL